MNLRMFNRTTQASLITLGLVGLMSVAGCGHKHGVHSTSDRHDSGSVERSQPVTGQSERHGGDHTSDGTQEVHPHDLETRTNESGAPRDVTLHEAQAREPSPQAPTRVQGASIDPPVIEEIMPRPKDGPPPSDSTPDAGTTTNAPKGKVVKRTVPGTAVGYEMVQVPGGAVTVLDDEGNEQTVEVKSFWIATTELSWDMYDIYVFNLDEQGVNAKADAVSRPSRPYIPPDRGFGHGGYPAISMTTQGATKFCEWLSAKTGRKYRVPTIAEWRLAALAGSEGPYSFGDNADLIDAYAWTENNSPDKTQPIGQKRPNALGMFDVEGNVMEWCLTMDGQGFVACGGSYYSTPEDSTAFSVAEQDWEWNMTDPQIPKSPWWLSDASWVGLRIICDDETVNAPKGEIDE